MPALIVLFFFFFNDTATTEIYTLSLHDALPICRGGKGPLSRRHLPPRRLHSHQSAAPSCRGLRSVQEWRGAGLRDRKSTRLNSSHANISYAVFCLKKKKNCYHVWELTDVMKDQG